MTTTRLDRLGRQLTVLTAALHGPGKTFGPALELGTTDRVTRLLTADLDGNGTPDLAFGDSLGLQIWLNQAHAGDPSVQFQPSTAPHCAGDPGAIYDLDGDRKPDAVALQPDGWLCAMVNQTTPDHTLGFASALVARTPYTTLYGIPDINHDGQPDLVAYAIGAPLVLLVSGSHCEPAQ